MYSLKKHVVEDHGENINVSSVKKTMCFYPHCQEAFYHHTQLIAHLQKDHDGKIEACQLEFTSMNEFLAWKEEEESKKFTYYSKQTSTKVQKNVSYMYHLCNKNGNSAPHRGKGKKKTKNTKM